MSRNISTDGLQDISARRICLIKPSALGDVVQTLPLLGALRHRFPEAEISWVINQDLAELITGHPELTEVIRFNRRGSWSESFRLMRSLGQRRFDLVFDLQGLARTALMNWATAAKLRIGLESALEGSRLACHRLLPNSNRDVPAHARYWRVAEALGVGDLPRTTHIPIFENDRLWATEHLKELTGPILAVHPGARWKTKRWPAEKFAAVVTKASETFGASVVTVGSRKETEFTQPIVEAVLARGGRALDLAGVTNLKQLAAVLQAADVLLSNDSGPMHLAAGLGTPVVGVFTCTSPVISGPPGDHHALVSTSVSCAAGYHKNCPHLGSGHLACLEELSTSRVWNALVQQLTRQTAEVCSV